MPPLPNASPSLRLFGPTTSLVSSPPLFRFPSALSLSPTHSLSLRLPSSFITSDDSSSRPFSPLARSRSPTCRSQLARPSPHLAATAPLPSNLPARPLRPSALPLMPADLPTHLPTSFTPLLTSHPSISTESAPGVRSRGLFTLLSETCRHRPAPISVVPSRRPTRPALIDTTVPWPFDFHAAGRVGEREWARGETRRGPPNRRFGKSLFPTGNRSRRKSENEPVRYRDTASNHSKRVVG